MLRAVETNAERLEILLATGHCNEWEHSTYPSIVIFVQKSDKITSAKPKFILHGRLKVKLNPIDVAGSSSIGTHCSWRSRGLAELGTS